MIAVHREISSNYRHNLRAAFAKMFFADFQIFASARWRRIAPIGKGVHENLIDSSGFRDVRERDHVVVMAVDTAIRNQA